MRRLALATVVLTAFSTVLTAAPASAQALFFELSGSRTASFTLDDSMPDSFTSSFIGDQIFFNNVAGSFGGTDGTADISFGTNLVADLNIQSSNLGFTQLSMPGDLFTGPASNPTFNTGTFNLSGGFTAGPATLTITRADAGAVPEPGTWAMMLLGFGGMGVAMRRRRRSGALIQQMA
jgi:hypothetical protein